MTTSIDFWKILAGVAFFLLAMNFMEEVLRQLAGRRFKLFLKRQAGNKLKAVSGATIVTGILQSSSIVNLLVLSMVGAGVLGMENALALVLGSNLGSTLSNWLIAIFGFNYSIDSLALPVTGVCGIIMAFINPERKLYPYLKFFFSLAFLFIALGFIRSGMEGFVRQTDLGSFNHYPLGVFLLIGMVITGIIQSSSATMALTLSALFAHAINMPAAMAIVLGAEIGTTFKLFLASANGQAIKKRLALGNLLINVITIFFLFAFIRPLNQFITSSVGIRDPLIALVFFQTLVNICSLIIFLPLLPKLSRFLLKRYKDHEEESLFISKVPVADTEIALEAFEKETSHFINLVTHYNLDLFELPVKKTFDDRFRKHFDQGSPEEKYSYIKQLHGEMHNYYLLLQNQSTDKAQTERLDQLISTIRNGMYAAKNIRDIRHDIDQLKNSSNDSKYGYYQQARERMEKFYEQIFPLLEMTEKNGHFKRLADIHQTVNAGYLESLKMLYKQGMADQVSEVEITTFINFNRQLYTSFKSMVFALKEYCLSAEEAAYFDNLPGFIR